MDKEEELDKYSHRLSIKNNICYENAQEIMNKSLKKIEDIDHKSNNIIRSAYKYSRKKQEGGSNNDYYKYLKYKTKYMVLQKN